MKQKAKEIIAVKASENPMAEMKEVEANCQIVSIV